MAINKDSNGFTFGFAAILVVAVGAILSITAISLKPKQTENQRQEKMKNILMTVGAMDRNSDMTTAPELFEKHVKNQYVLDFDGNLKDGLVAFDVDVMKENRSLPKEERSYPMYECEMNNETFYVIPMVGKGLWGPIWGFVALKSDMKTVYGSIFDHKSETPGLGAEISQAGFQNQFENKTIFDDAGNFTSVKVVKGNATNNYSVDGITGGTITSNGVHDMLENTLRVYVPYFESKK